MKENGIDPMFLSINSPHSPARPELFFFRFHGIFIDFNEGGTA
jgi:hypothetical protein